MSLGRPASGASRACSAVFQHGLLFGIQVGGQKLDGASQRVDAKSLILSLMA